MNRRMNQNLGGGGRNNVSCNEFSSQFLLIFLMIHICHPSVVWVLGV